jgi:hypothetical protein
MKKLAIYLLITLLIVTQSKAQWVVSDPMHTGITTAIKFLQEPSFQSLVSNVKELKKISSFIQNIQRGYEVVSLSIELLSSINAYGVAIANDTHILPNEYKLITKDFSNFGKEAASIAQDLSNVVAQNGSSMDDGARLNLVNSVTERMKKLKASLEGYVSRIQYISMKRSFASDDKLATARLYGLANTGGGGSTYSGSGINIKPVYSDKYDKVEDDMAKQRAMAKEAAAIQQELNSELNYKIQQARADSKIAAVQTYPKLEQDDFVGLCKLGLDGGGNKETCNTKFEAYSQRIDAFREKMMNDLTKAPIKTYTQEMQNQYDAAMEELRKKYGLG